MCSSASSGVSSALRPKLRVARAHCRPAPLSAHPAVRRCGRAARGIAVIGLPDPRCYGAGADDNELLRFASKAGGEDAATT